MKNPWIIIGVVVAVLLGGSVWYSSTAAEKYNEGVTEVTHVKGNPDGAVTLIKYSDFQCPACAQFAPVVDEMLAEFGDDVRFEYRQFPLMQIHPSAELAARSAEAAGQQGKFYEYHDKLFENQAAWSSSPNPAQFFARYAEELELDMTQFRNQQRSSILRDKVMREFDEARSAGFTGTPTFVLNGERMNISTYQDFRDQIAAAVNPEVNLGETATPSEDVVDVEFGI